MITRKLGALLRGKATPFQLMAASVLGTLVGFAPGFTQAPALYLLLVAALLLVNANLGLALLAAGLAKVLSLLAAPVSFEIGRFLLDGPTSSLARAIVNAPVLAWCGLEYYAVAGGQLLGLVVGAAGGLVVTRSVGSFRRRMMAAQDDGSRLRELAAKPWARFMMWLFFGGKGKKSWEEKLQKRVGNPVRIWGAALIVLALVGVYSVHQTLAGPMARHGLRIGLEEANGATVDVGTVELDLGEGILGVANLALADPGALERNLFSAGRLEADIGQADLLRRRVRVARAVISDARSGEAREEPGKLVRPVEVAEPAETERTLPDVGDFSLEDVLAEYDVWKERLGQAQRWLEKLSGEPDERQAGADEETFRERIAREARERGWFSVQAGHLVDEAPTFQLSELLIEGFETTYLPGRVLDVNASELSTHPALVDAPPQVVIASRDGDVRFEVDLAPVSRGGGDGALRVQWKGLAIDDAMSQLSLSGPAPFQGGTLDLSIDGAWDDGRIGHVDLPLRVTLRDTLFQMEGVEPTRMDELVLPIGLSGPIDAPRIRFDSSALSDALVEAGKAELANRVRSELEGELGEQLEELEEKIDVDLPEGLDEKVPEGAKDALRGLLGGKKKEDSP